MVSTTLADLRLRAADRGIEPERSRDDRPDCAGSLTGLQNYRFGNATTLPFEDALGGDGVPDSVVATIEDNRDRDLHTLVYLDIKVTTPTGMEAPRRGAPVRPPSTTSSHRTCAGTAAVLT